MTSGRRFARALVACTVIVSLLLVTALPVAAGSTKLVKDFRQGAKSSNLEGFVALRGMVFLVDDREIINKNSSSQTRLWRTKGSPRSTIKLAGSDAWIGFAGRHEGHYIFYDCWRCNFQHLAPMSSDGTRRGTRRRPDLQDLIHIQRDSVRLGDAVLYAGYGGAAPYRRQQGLYRSSDDRLGEDELVMGTDHTLTQLTRLGNRAVFVGPAATNGRELWITDGTASGTQMLRDIRPGPRGSNPANLVAVGRRVFFTANDGRRGKELWVTDGTSQGTRLVRNIRAGAASSSPSWLTPYRGRVVFTAADGRHGRELWISDGSARGTKLVRDIRRGKKGSLPTDLATVGRRLYFAANDGKRGRELWSTGGRFRSTRIAKDIVRGKRGSSPQQLTALGRQLIFTAKTPKYGRELWAHKP